MKINFTNREYRTLLNMLMLADWMLHAHDEDCEDDDHAQLLQKIMALAGEYGCADKVEFLAEENAYYATQTYEDSDEVAGVIKAYDEGTFWSELTHRMAVHDVARAVGAERLEQMPNAERFKLIDAAEERYNTEFELNGLKGLRFGWSQG